MYPKDAVPRRRRPLLNQNRTQLTRSICPRPHIIIIDVADQKKKRELQFPLYFLPSTLDRRIPAVA